MIANHVRRPLPVSARQVSEPNTQARMWIDSLGFESLYDYDPFWKRCTELKVAVTAHSGSMGWNGRESINSFTFNHIGHFANASHAFARALILGGVTHRFPAAPLGVPRGRRGLGVQPRDRPHRPLGEAPQGRDGEPDPADEHRHADAQGPVRALRRPAYEEKWDEIVGSIAMAEPFRTAEELTERAYKETFDDFGQVPVESAEELRQHFAERFYFGCEADDPITAWAFDRHGKHRLRPSSAPTSGTSTWST